MSHTPSRTAQELRRNAETLLHSLSLPPAADLETIVRRTADTTGLRVEVDPVGDKDWETVTGLVLVSQGRARILVRKSDPPWYQFHAVLHELAHLLFGHIGCGTLPARHPAAHHGPQGVSVLARGVVNVDFDREVDFDCPSTVIEAEAEKLAQLLSRVALTPATGRDEAVFG